MPFKTTKTHRSIAIGLFIILLSMSYQSTQYLWGTKYTIIAWIIPILLNINNWWYKRANEK